MMSMTNFPARAVLGAFGTAAVAGPWPTTIATPVTPACLSPGVGRLRLRRRSPRIH